MNNTCEKLSETLISFSKGNVVILFLAVFLLFVAIVLPTESTKTAKYTGGEGSPDLSLFYTQQDLYRMAEQFGAQGRQAYVKARFTFDLAFPLVYGAFLLTSIAWLLGKITLSAAPVRLLTYFPLAAVVFDLLENITASFVIGRYPTPSPFAAAAAPFFTFIKWFFVGGSFALAAILLIIYIFKRLKK